MYMQLLLYGLSVIGFPVIGSYQQLFHSKGGTVSVELDKKNLFVYIYYTSSELY